MIDLKFIASFEDSTEICEENLVGNFSATYRSDVMFINESQNIRYTIDIVNDKAYPEDEIILANFYKILFNIQKNNIVKDIDVYFKNLNDDGSEKENKEYQLLNIVEEGQIVGVHYRKDIRPRGVAIGSLQLEYRI